jgi:PAS domain-containing protein
MNRSRGVLSADVRAFSFDAALTEKFVGLCERLYADDPCWTPRPRETVRAQFAPEHRFYRGSGRRHRHFAAVREGELIGHVSAFLDPHMLDCEGHPAGCLGFFECVEDYPIAEELLGSAVEWLQHHAGLSCIRGPIDFDIWSGYRFKRRGFEHGTFLGEPHNKHYYPAFFERFGFAVRKKWYSTEIRGRRALEGVVAKSEERYRSVLSAGYRFRPFDGRDLEDLRALHVLVNRSYEGFLGFTEIELREFERGFGGQLRSMDSRFVTLVHDPTDAIVGFSIAFPDSDRVVCHTMGITPEEVEKRHGLGSALAFHMIRSVLEAGFETALVALVAEDSPVRAIAGGRIDRADIEYALYELAP